MLSHKNDLKKFTMIRIMLSIFSSHNGIKLEINYKRKIGKFTNVWGLTTCYWATKGLIKKKIKGEVGK